jgi:hypothetical protein
MDCGSSVSFAAAGSLWHFGHALRSIRLSARSFWQINVEVLVMKYLSFALLAVPLALVVGPARAADEKLAESPYYPLKVGNAWTYKIGDTKFVLKVAKFEEKNKQLCARIEMSVNDKVQAVEHVAVKDDGVYRYAFENKEADPPVKFLKLPPKKDETWDVKSTIGAEKLSGTFKIGEMDKLTVSGKDYPNVITSSSENLDANGQKITFTYYFAKDVGMIKQTIKISGQEVVIDLEKFEPGK